MSFSRTAFTCCKPRLTSRLAGLRILWKSALKKLMQKIYEKKSREPVLGHHWIIFLLHHQMLPAQGLHLPHRLLDENDPDVVHLLHPQLFHLPLISLHYLLNLSPRSQDNLEGSTIGDLPHGGVSEHPSNEGIGVSLVRVLSHPLP